MSWHRLSTSEPAVPNPVRAGSRHRARLSELLGLTWADIDLADTSAANVTFSYQVDRQGVRAPLKTEQSRRTVEIPRSLAALLLEHKARSAHTASSAFLFGTRSGRAIGQRNVLREMRRAMRAAVDAKGRPTFPVMHELDDRGKPVPVPRGSVPSFHSFRHTAASEAIAAGDGAEEVVAVGPPQLQRNAHRLRPGDQERRAAGQAQGKLEGRYGALLGSAMEAADSSSSQQTATVGGAEVLPLRQKAADGSRA